MEYKFSIEERVLVRDTEPLKGFIKKYNVAIYDAIEEESNLVGKTIQFKKGGFFGYVISLYAPLDENLYRKKHIWYVRWKNGNFGIIERNDIVLKEEEVI